MAEIISFKKHLQNQTHGTDEFGGLPDKWRLREFSVDSKEKADKAVISLFDSIDNLDECRLFHVINPIGEMAASFALLQSQNWVESTAFNSQIRAGEVLQALAKLYRHNQWLTEFDWKRGYVFDEDGKAYSVNALPDAVEIYGSVSIRDATGVFLPPLFSVRGGLTISNTTIARSPRYIKCFDLNISCSSMYEIARRIVVIGTLEVEDSSVKRLCHTGIIAKDLKLTRLKRRVAMPEACTVSGDLIIEDVSLDIFDQNIVIGDLKEHYSDDRKPYLGRDFLGQLLAPFSAIKFLNLIEHDRHGYPINIQNTKDLYGFFVCRNDDGSYLCVIGPDTEPRQFVDVQRMDVISARALPALPTL